jgi:ATP-binding cassette subfamily F protein 3
MPTTIIKHVSKSVLAGQRIGVLGANGQGKSTVVKTIARTLKPIAGDIVEGKGLNIGYFAQQELDVLNPSDNPLEHMIALVKKTTSEGNLSGQPTREQDLRAFLGMFNFSGDMIFQTVGTMSGGEKARLVLCMIVWQRPNLLLLDEPTNHLDLATREALSMALNEFEGTVMLVSHDRALLRAVCDEFWMVSKGGIAPFDGDLEDYQRYLLDEAKRQRELAKKEVQTPIASVAPITIEPNPVVKKSFVSPEQKKIQKELEKMNEKIEKLTSERKRLHEQLETLTNLEEITTTGKKIGVLEEDLSKLEESWLSLSESLEA